MHGRVKVRTSEEEKARKEKERQEKLKVFKHVMKKIHDKRKEKELDNEMLEITGKVLVSNPDIYTLWNIRREVLNSLRDTIESEENKAKLYDEELTLTEYCLKINPKSYCAWHQREWVLITRTDPDWKKELNLCDIYLKLDERNFHTWDYRRFIVAQCKPPLKDEFDFTTEKIYENFSNYSAWHYRSKMLVELHPDLEGGRPIEDNKHKHELKIVQSAAFTDPDDTSAWFYQRWLLGAVKKSLNVAVCTVTPLKTTVAFSQHVPYDFVKSKVQLVINNVPISGDWISCSDNTYDILWIYKHNESIRDNVNITVEYEANGGEKQIIQCVKNINSVKYTGRSEIEFQANYSQAVVDELKQQLEACRQLLSMEPDNKWTLLTTTVFLHCIDAKLYHKETIQNLQTLRKIDSLRAGYYDDLMTKWNIEEQLSKYCKGDIDEFKILFQEKITSLPHLQYYSYCDVVDLSNQNLTSKVLPSLVVLQHCKVLRLNKNNLTTLKGFPILELEELHLQNNDLDENEVKHFKEKCKYNVYF